MSAISAGVKNMPTGDVLPLAPRERETLPEITSLVAASALLFLFARSIVWGQFVSFEDVAALMLGTTPVVVAIISQSRFGVANVVRVLGWGWVLSLLLFNTLHVLRLFEGFEQPIRAIFQAGTLRYICYGLVYSAFAYLILSATAACFGKRALSGISVALLAGGFAFNSAFFGVALFLIRL